MAVGATEVCGAYNKRGMNGVVALLDLINKLEQKGSSPVDFGSSSLGPKVRLGLIELHAAVGTRTDRRLPFFYIGRPASRDGTIPAFTPLQHMALILEVIDLVSQDARDSFNLLCETLAQSIAHVHRRVEMNL